MGRIVQYTKTKLVSRHRGTLPILLTCPHDGGEAPASVRKRTEGNTPDDCTGANKFKSGRDSRTSDITRGVAQKMYEVWGESPYVVIAEFSREYIDANRPSDSRNNNCAFNSANARKFYDEYHKWINTYVGHILDNNNNKGFLFDIHGTRLIPEDPADIYLGTRNNSTLQTGFNRDLLFKRRGLVGLLQASKYTIGFFGDTFRPVVSPANKNTSETGEVNGGFTIKNYGGRINAIQLEHAPEMRNNDDKRNIIIEEYAYTMVNFCKQITGV